MRGGLDDQGVVGAEEVHEAGEVLVLASGGALGETDHGSDLHGLQLSLHTSLGFPEEGKMIIMVSVWGHHPTLKM